MEKFSTHFDPETIETMRRNLIKYIDDYAYPFPDSMRMQLKEYLEGRNADPNEKPDRHLWVLDYFYAFGPRKTYDALMIHIAFAKNLRF